MAEEGTQKDVSDYWNREPCLTDKAKAPRYSKAYFDEIDEFRYRMEPESFSFTQFTRHCGQKILEVGIGAGSDFQQWVKAGTIAHGIDLTPESVLHVKKRLEIKNILTSYPVETKSICTRVTNHDPWINRSLWIRFPLYLLSCLPGHQRCGWFMTIELTEKPLQSL